MHLPLGEAEWGLGPGRPWCGAAPRPVLSGLVRCKSAILEPWPEDSPEHSARGHIDLRMAFSARGEERSRQPSPAGLAMTETHAGPGRRLVTSQLERPSLRSSPFSLELDDTSPQKGNSANSGHPFGPVLTMITNHMFPEESCAAIAQGGLRSHTPLPGDPGPFSPAPPGRWPCLLPFVCFSVREPDQMCPVRLGRFILQHNIRDFLSLNHFQPYVT